MQEGINTDYIPNSDTSHQSRGCNYLGHLEGDEANSAVAVTGCLMGDDLDDKMHITLLSHLNTKSTIYELDYYGNAIAQENPFKYQTGFT